MKKTAFVLLALLMGAAFVPRGIAAQEKPAPVPLKLQLVVSRVAGDKKVSSLPYTLWVTANDPNRRTTSVRMGVQVPVISSRPAAEKSEATSGLTYNYQQVGTSIDCSASSTAGGGFQVTLTLNDTSIHYDPKAGASTPMPAGIAGVPAFRNFTSNFSIMLKDGQTAQYTSATDPLTGEVLRVDVTVNVLK